MSFQHVSQRHKAHVDCIIRNNHQTAYRGCKIIKPCLNKSFANRTGKHLEDYVHIFNLDTYLNNKMSDSLAELKKLKENLFLV